MITFKDFCNESKSNTRVNESSLDYEKTHEYKGIFINNDEFSKNGNKIKIYYVGVCQKDVSIKVYDADDTNPHYYLYELGDLKSLKINTIENTSKDILASTKTKIKDLTQVYSVDSFNTNDNGSIVINFKFSENKYNMNYIVGSKENLKKLKDFYKEIEQILNKNIYKLQFKVDHHTTGFSCIAELV